MNYFTSVLTQVLALFAIIIIGYILFKIKALPENADRALSRVLAVVVSPALCFNSFSKNLSLEVISSKLPYILFGLGTLVFSFIIGILLSRFFAKDTYSKIIYTYSLTISNFGYMGYALIGGIFGEEMLANMIIFALPFSIAIYVIGYPVLTGHNKISAKYLINPVFIGTLVGAAVGLSGIKLPNFAVNVASSLSSCMGPLAMLVTGLVIAKYDILSLINKKRIYLVCLIKMVVMPAIIVLIMRLLHVENDIIIIALGTTAMSLGLNTVVYPASCGQDTTMGASMALISNVLGVITIPIMFMLFLQ